jgi:hypothetical protein
LISYNEIILEKHARGHVTNKEDIKMKYTTNNSNNSAALFATRAGNALELQAAVRAFEDFNHQRLSFAPEAAAPTSRS